VSFARSLRLLSAALLTTSAPLLAGEPCTYFPADDPDRLPCLARAATAEHAEEPTLRVASFNVHYGRDVDGIARAIRADSELREADVLLLQEIESYPHDPRAEKLAERLGMHLVYGPGRAKKNGTHGLAILSRRALRDAELLALPRFDLGWGTQRRVALAATLDWNGVEVRVVNVHLDTRLTAAQRFQQMRPVIERASVHARVVIGGDVNTISCVPGLLPGVPIALPGTSQGPAFDAFMRGYGYLTPFRRIGWTGPLRQRLDAIFVRGLRVGAFDKEDDVRVSDHIPLWADIGLPEPENGVGALLAAPLLPYRPTF
jgi:endonuclease/exonuclease/phosphatase family metal-dependent hydrolase